MIRTADVAGLVFVCCALASCRHAQEPATQEPLTIEIPPNLVTATDAQKQLVADIKSLQRGWSPLEARTKLGTPTLETTDTLCYQLIEDEQEGGYSITATLSFQNGELTSATVEQDHESRSPTN